MLRITFAMTLCVALSWPATSHGADKLQYNRDIRPILAENCFACHGPDSAARQADLRLDKRDIALEMKALVPLKPDESESLRRIMSANPDEVMPPPQTKKTLTAAQKEILRRWISEGAEYEPHWSLIAPIRPPVPTVKNKQWVRNPIDAFILARLEASGLTPAPEADKRTLARRLSLDLTGLPPTPEDVAAFVNDASPEAYEKYVDRLLASKHWGEHRGRYWLDAARYADTHGIHFDNYREMWSYREWVIDAFNRNLPFDQFTIEQLAGDLLPNRTPEQQVASGFNRCNITTNEGGVIAEEYLVLYTRDRTETVAQVWLATTAGCSVCHDHKFDPLSQKEFYEMAAFFNNTTQGAMDGNVKDTPPIIAITRAEDRAAIAAIDNELPQIRKQLEARRASARKSFDGWMNGATADALAKSLPSDKLHLHAALAKPEGGEAKTITIAVDGQARAVPLGEKTTWIAGPAGLEVAQVQGAAAEIAEAGDFERDQPFTAAAWVRLQANDASGAIAARMDDASAYRGWDFWMQRRQVGAHIINQWPENGLKVVAKNQVPANQWTHVAVTYDGSSKAAGVKVFYNGEPQETNVEADRLSDSTRTTAPFKIGQRHTRDMLSAGGIADLRIYGRALSAGEITSLAKTSHFAAVLAKPAAERSEKETNELYGWWLGTMDAETIQWQRELSRKEQEKAGLLARGTIAHVMQEKAEMPGAFVLNRGEYDQRKDAVKPATPAFLPAMPAELPRNRLGFAQWLLRPEHPLTARAAVNRYWQEVFGTGIVRTAGDFGVAGELPSHPELLDWLAVEFREKNWDIKQFFKLIVTSSTYRQAAIATPEKLEKDRENRLVSRGPRFRMDAEMVRDYTLASSGLLVRKLGGPSVKPYQPAGVWEAVAMIGSNTRDYRRDSGENLYRRSLYTFWKRSAPPASMEIFNAPNRETCAVRRERTNTPLQALVTLNDPQHVEAARVLAQQALLSGGESDDAKVDFIAQRLLARGLTPAELAVVRSSLHDLRAYYEANVENAAKLIAVGDMKADDKLPPSLLAAWTMLTNELMNLDEVLNK